jgi:hypothetical protein
VDCTIHAVVCRELDKNPRMGIWVQEECLQRIMRWSRIQNRCQIREHRQSDAENADGELAMIHWH